MRMRECDSSLRYKIQGREGIRSAMGRQRGAGLGGIAIKGLQRYLRCEKGGASHRRLATGAAALQL